MTNLSHAYAADKRFGNSALTVAGGHTLDALCFVAGEEFREVAGVVKLHFTRQRVIETGEVINDLRAIPAVAGQCHYLPSGTCHALGAGILVAEVQTPSDTTFRVYDWGRSGRALHIAQGLALW